MLLYRCTRKLLTKIKPTATPTSSSDTQLGDWYVDYIYSRPFHLALFTSELSLLPVIVPAAPVITLFPRFEESLRQVLRAMAIQESIINREISLMKDYAVTKTNSRSILGTMNDFKSMISFYEYDENHQPLLWLSLHIGEAPCRPISYKRPIDMIKEILR
jgi:hypothetical protein